MFHYEHKHEPLLPWRVFLLRRVAKSLALGLGVIGISLLAGMLGYRIAESMGWLDAFLNAAMILGGMGPVDALHTSGGKVFAGIYALYSGLVVIFVAGLLFAPFAHRLLHRFHLDTGRDTDGS
jgi:sterol desaturase/sphingolipid hydroxylase (fatty acid hydroxylase superfamily)